MAIFRIKDTHSGLSYPLEEEYSVHVEAGSGACKIGLDTGEREIRKAKCRIKICCFGDNRFDTCADCSKFESCNLIGSWYVKKGYHGEKYKQSLEYIKKNTYSEFIKVADKWKGASGRLD